MRLNLVQSVFLVGFAGLAAACSSDTGVPLSTGSANTTAAGNLQATLGGAGDAAAFLDESSIVGTVGALIGTASCDASGTGSAVAPTTSFDLGMGTSDLAAWLTDHVFREDLVESDSGTTVVYLLDPAVVCGSDPATRDEGCYSFLEETPVRLRVRAPREGDLDIAVLVGPDRTQLASFRLYGDELAVRVDLNAVKRLIETITADSPDAPELPDVIEGVLEVALIQNADQDFTLQASVVESVRVTLDQNDPASLDFRLARANPAMAIRADGLAQQLTLEAGWNALDLALPGSMVCDNNPDCGVNESEGLFSLHVDGAKGSVVVDGQAEEIRASDVGLGGDDSFLDLNDDRLVEVGLNRDHNRKFAATLKEVTDGLELTVSPAIDLEVAIALMHLSDMLKADLPAWLEDEVFSLMLGGPPQARLLLPKEDCSGSSTSEQVEVLEGTLTLSATSLEQDVVAPTGMCLEGTAVPDVHPFESVAVVMCL